MQLKFENYVITYSGGKAIVQLKDGRQSPKLDPSEVNTWLEEKEKEHASK